MTDNELIDSFRQERINMMLRLLDKNQPQKSQADHDKILQAEKIIEELPDDDRVLIQNYIEEIMERMAREEPYLYTQGFYDGIKISNMIMNLGQQD